MSERGPRGGFESFSFGHERREETPEQRFRSELRREANRVRWETIDPAAREIAAKVDEKLALKERTDDIHAHRDNTAIYQPLKQLGVFMVADTKAKADWRHNEVGFSVNRGDPVLDLHLPPLAPDRRNLVEVTRSLGLVADYMVEQNLQPEYVIGITYEKLARVSQRQGFTVVDVPIPAELKRGVQRVHDKFRDGKDMGRIMLCFQTREQFLERFHKPQGTSILKK